MDRVKITKQMLKKHEKIIMFEVKKMYQEINVKL